MRFSLLGSLQVMHDDHEAELGGHKQRVVLAALLLSPNDVVPIDRLIENVWGEQAPRTAAHSIHIYVSELRKALRSIGLDEVIVTRDPGYVLAADEGAIDIAAFDGLVEQAAHALGAGRPDRAVECVETALDLWRGSPLSDFTYDEFAQAEIRRLTERHVRAVELLAEAELTTGAVDTALPRLQHLVDVHPLRESATGMLMTALHRSGRPAEALRAYQQLRARLAEERGLEPAAHLQRLEERILLQDPTLQPKPSPGEVRNPFKGLRPFDEEDAPDFFGREALTARLVDELASGTRLVSLVGPSGSGKSSAARAGLIPRLRAGAVDGSDTWAIGIMTPGPQPFRALLSTVAAALPPGCLDGSGDDPRELFKGLDAAAATGREVLVCIDQLEELFTLATDEWARRAFLDLLAEAVAAPDIPFRLVTTLRGDYYDRPLLYPGFGELFADSVISVMPLTPSELGAAVSGPAARAGAAAEAQLIAALVADVAGQAGALPVFQYTLTELFERRTGNTLTLESYREFGGLAGALRKRADAAFESLSTEQQDVMRQVMLRLVRADADDTNALRRVPASELAALPVDPVALHTAVDLFGGLRLLTFDHLPDGSATVEIAHEALIDTWPQLRRWIDRSRADLRRHGSLAAAIATWEEAGRDPDYLPLGAQLRALERWLDSSNLQLTEAEREYVEAARDHRRGLEEEEATRRRRARQLAARARGAGPKIAFVHEGRGDESYCDLIALGWDRAMREFTFQGGEYVFSPDPDRELRQALREGPELVLGGGYFHADAIAEMATAHPHVQFVILETVLDLPNVTSIIFENHEGSFLAGVAAACVTESGTIGFVGGTRLPLIEQFQAGFEAGALATNPAVEVLATYLPARGRTAFYELHLGERAGHVLAEHEADVVFAASGASGWSVLEPLIERSRDGLHRWFIGADNDFYLAAAERQRPHILTSVLKRVDLAIHDSIADYIAGRLAVGTRTLGLAEEGVELARSGGFLDAHEGELTVAASRLAAGAVEIPAPSGEVVPLRVG